METNGSATRYLLMLALGLVIPLVFVAVSEAQPGERPCLTNPIKESGESPISKGEAKANAEARWEGYTRATRGNRYAEFKNARNVTIRCQRLPGKYKCEVIATPCEQNSK